MDSSLVVPLEFSLVLSVFGHWATGPASLCGHHENYLIWVDSSLMSPLELLWPLPHGSSASCLTISRTIWSEWLGSDSPTWLLRNFSLEFPLRFIYRTVSDNFIIYDLLHTVSFFATIINLFCSLMMHFCTVWLFCSIVFAFDYWLIICYCSLFWCWNCIPGILIP